MTAESADPRGGAFTRGRLAFRRWRRTRPFWGGLFLILAGLEIFYSGNRSLGNLQVHLGMAGFQSYLIPLVLILCGALVWFTPDQRIFYGVIGLADAIYSLVGANIGGFLLGFLFGVLGGGLSVAWVPMRKRSVEAGAEHDGDEQQTEDLGPTADDDDSTLALLPSSDDHDDARLASDSDDEGEGKQGASFPGPRHAADDPEVTETNAETGEAPGLASRLRTPPRGAIVFLAVATLGAIGLVTLPTSQSASAEACASPSLQRLLQQHGATTSARQSGTSTRHSSSTARQSASKKGSAAPATKATATASTAKTNATSVAATATTASSATETSATKTATAEPAVLGTVISALDTLLPGVMAPAAGDPAPSASPTDSPTPTPSPTAEPTQTASPTPSAAPTSNPTPKPTSNPTAAPTKTTDPGPSSPKPSPSASQICSVSKTFAASSALPAAGKTPSKMTAGMLTMSNLAYQGIATLQSSDGTPLKALYFTMDSSTSTPFELQPKVGDGIIDIKSSQLTVSGNVAFYCTSISGNLEGALPVTFTVDSPPPLVLPDMFFTDATLQLALVQSDVLTAPGLTITNP